MEKQEKKIKEQQKKKIEVRLMRLLMDNDYQKNKLDKKIKNFRGPTEDLIELIVDKGGIVGRVETLGNILHSIDDYF